MSTENNEEISETRKVAAQSESAKKQLIALGVHPEKFEEALALLNLIADAEIKLEKARKLQFYDDAIGVTSLRPNKPETIAEHLRSFAEHIAQRTVQQIAPDYEGDVYVLVDNIDPMKKIERRKDYAGDTY